jgi:hypothetical protein
VIADTDEPEHIKFSTWLTTVTYVWPQLDTIWTDEIAEIENLATGEGNESDEMYAPDSHTRSEAGSEASRYIVYGLQLYANR